MKVEGVECSERSCAGGSSAAIYFTTLKRRKSNSTRGSPDSNHILQRLKCAEGQQNNEREVLKR